MEYNYTMPYRYIFQQSHQFQMMRQQSEEWRLIQQKRFDALDREGIVAECYRLKELNRANLLSQDPYRDLDSDQ